MLEVDHRSLSKAVVLALDYRLLLSTNGEALAISGASDSHLVPNMVRPLLGLSPPPSTQL